MNLKDLGFGIVSTGLAAKLLAELRENLFQSEVPGQRCLLDIEIVRNAAFALKSELVAGGHLLPQAVAIQAIAFDKTSAANWKVAWHQDLMFPFASRVTSPDFRLPTLKQGVHYAQPPESVLKQLLAVRLHLDDCDATNGPLKVSPRTHRAGILKASEIAKQVISNGEFTCFAKTGEALLMHPLTLHASSQASEPKHRRILHFVYHSGDPMSELWYRSV